MLLKLLSKKRVKEILTLLDKHGEMYFAQINEHIPISKSTLSVLLNELVLAGLLEKREGTDKQKLPKTYYKLTDFGKTALILYEIEEKLEKLRKMPNTKLQYKIVYGKNVITDSNINNSKISMN